MRKIFVVIGLVLAVFMGGTAAAVSKPSPVARITKPVPLVRVYHPCDLNRDTYAGTSLERLCMRVWGHDMYTVTDKYGITTTPSGPVVVVDLIAESRTEGGHAYLRMGLLNEMDMYGKRDR